MSTHPELGTNNINRSWVENASRTKSASHAVPPRAAEQKLRAAAQAQAETKDFQKRPFAERQAALNLAQFARQNQDLNISADLVENLVSTLIVSSCRLGNP